MTRPAPVPQRDATPPRRPRWLAAAWTLFVLGAILTLDIWELRTWGLVVPAAGGALALVTSPLARSVTWVRARPDWTDLAVIAGLYVAVVGLFRLAFVGFGTGRVLGLFLSFAAGLLLGVAVPVVYTVWFRHRDLRSLGIGAQNLRETLTLGGVLAATQFAMTLWRIELPAPVDWVPLLVMSVTVGLFEAIFFRGFVQTRLEASFGIIPAVTVAAGLYGAYHVGYGMGADELMFLFGLGIVYAVAFRLVENILVLWPLLTPLGAFFNNVSAGDIELPWASIAGFADVLGLMTLIIWLGWRQGRPRRPRRPRRRGAQMTARR